MVELVIIMFLSLAARDEAALRYDDSVQRYIEAVHSGAEDLQKRGLIKYARGTITILDRKGLENAVCECYKVVIDEYDRLLGAYVPKNR